MKKYLTAHQWFSGKDVPGVEIRTLLKRVIHEGDTARPSDYTEPLPCYQFKEGEWLSVPEGWYVWQRRNGYYQCEPETIFLAYYEPTSKPNRYRRKKRDGQRG